MDFQPLIQRIEAYDSIVIFGHIHPDGDCYGSQIGLKEALKMHYPNKKIYAVGTGYRKFLEMISPMDEITLDVIENSLAIALDFNSIDRAEDQRILHAKEQIMIDHHIEGNSFGTVRWIDDARVATCEMIAELIIENHWELNETGANALYLGLVTDSGRFQYQPLTVKTFNYAAFLIEKGANSNEIYHRLYEINEDSLLLKGYVYSHYMKTKKGVIYIYFTPDALELFNLESHHASLMVNFISNIKGFPIWVCFAEDESGVIKVEVRSSGPFIQPVCARHGGGGHPLAAGCTVKTREETLEILKELDELIVKE